MSSPRIEEIIDALRRAGSVEGAARILGVSPQRLRLYAAGLAGNGLLAIVRGQEKQGCGDCSVCPFAGLCGVPRRRPSGRPSPFRGRR